MATKENPSFSYGTREWFQNRAKSSLVKVSEGLWDFSDSALFWTDEAVKKYEDAQTADQDTYKKQVTDKETVYLKKITPDVVSRLPTKINYIDLGPGTENKQDYFIDEIRKQRKELSYTPVDINKIILDAVSHHISEKGIDTYPIHSSFEDMEKYILDKTTPRFISLGLTFLNFQIDNILQIFKKSLNAGGLVFINTQPREKVSDLEELRKAYLSEHVVDMYNNKLKLIGLEHNQNIGTIEVTNEVKIYYNVVRPTEQAASLGIKAGDKIFVFQSMRYEVGYLKNKLESEFQCEYFDTGDEYVAVLMRNK